MNEQIKRKWIKALRSGKYKQTTGVYYSDIGYCCLGVLREVTITPDQNPVWTFSDFDSTCGLSQEDSRDLAVLNDSGATFEQIALCIENGL